MVTCSHCVRYLFLTGLNFTNRFRVSIPLIQLFLSMQVFQDENLF